MPPASQLDPRVDHFVSQALPPVLRRMRCWKGLDPRRERELVDDAVQDVMVDCLEHPRALAAMPSRERHARWFRLVERRAYAHWRRDRVLRDDRVPLDRLACASRTPWVAEEGLGLLAEPRREIAHKLAGAALRLRNGRLNAEATGARLGMPPRAVRKAWDELADELGFGREFLEFGRRRLVEALVGLAADLLRDGGSVRLRDEGARPRPDPRARMMGIRKIRRRLSVRPLPRDLRGVLARFSTPGGAAAGPRAALDAAVGLAPDDVRVRLWRFEAAVAHGEVREAGRELCHARRLGAESGRVLLARARLLEARGRLRAAGALLRRAARRRRGDSRLRAALRAFESAS